MIKLQNISKTYISETKQEVHALDDVSFELASCGMVFILGKSGSGKSTLLNLLGGLDAPSSGELVVDGVSMKDFSREDYDAYRNGYVGFIFQEYNLLEDLNVKDNVALALHLSGDEAGAKVVEALNRVELDEEYLTRHADEMSGGEKQRVAIARAIVKDSKVILADEPTGNLDSKTGKSIWAILKDLSREKLVVVVSHDRDSATKYADRIIEIADGKILSDTGAQPEETSEAQEPFTPQKKHLPFKMCLKMAAKNLLQHKMKTVGVVILSFLCSIALLMAQMSVCFSPERSAAQYIKRNNVQYFTVAQGQVDDNGYFQCSGTLTDKTRKYVTSRTQYIETVINRMSDLTSTERGLVGLVESAQDILDFGLKFAGNYLPLDSGSYYVTKQALEAAYTDGRSYFVDESNDNAQVKLVKALHPAEFLVGKHVYVSDCVEGFFGNPPRLAGVIDTDNLDISSLDYIPHIFATKEFDGMVVSDFGVQQKVYFDDKTISYLDKSFIFTKLTPSFRYRKTLMLDSDTNEAVLKGDDEITLADNEIIISYELYEKVFDVTDLKFDWVDRSLNVVKKVPAELGKNFTLTMHDTKGNVSLTLGNYKVVGIRFTQATNYAGYGSGDYEIICDEKTVNFLLASSNASYLIKTNSVSNLNGFLAKLRFNYKGYVSGSGLSEYSDGYSNSFVETSTALYSFEEYVRLLMFLISGAIGLILLVVMMLLTITMISFSIIARTREIGVLSALGASNKDINKIFLFETLIISALTVVLSLVGVSVIAPILNKLYAYELHPTIPFLRIDVLTVLAAFVVSAGFQLLATLLPLRRVNKMKPIDAIRDN